MWRHCRRTFQLHWKHRELHFITAKSIQSPCYRQLSSTQFSDVEVAQSVQSIIKSRRTGTSLVHTLDNRQKEEDLIIDAIRRAVSCAQMAPNHKRTEPWSCIQILNSSSATDELSEIAYQVAARTKSVPVARKKKEKWSKIPAYVVTLVHGNQNAVDIHKDESARFEALPYAPPVTERQLEDYASASSAIQNILLSLHADGITTKWATGPVVATPAFRELIQAKSTDRVAALIMLGGVDSTKFGSDKEEKITTARRQRRRQVDGDLLQSLP